MNEFEVEVSMLLETQTKFEAEFDGESWVLRVYNEDRGCATAKGKSLRAAVQNLKRLLIKVK